MPLAGGEREAIEWIRLDIRDLEKHAHRRILDLFWGGHFLSLDWNERAGSLALEQVILDLAESDPEVRQILKLQLRPGRGAWSVITAVAGRRLATTSTGRPGRTMRPRGTNRRPNSRRRMRWRPVRTAQLPPPSATPTVPIAPPPTPRHRAGGGGFRRGAVWSAGRSCGILHACLIDLRFLSRVRIPSARAGRGRPRSPGSTSAGDRGMRGVGRKGFP